MGWMWTARPDESVPDPARLRHALDASVRIGFERTQEQDAAFGIRQLVDMACKALSPAVNDPYTAVQAVDHLSVIFCALAVRPLGDFVARDPGGTGRVIVPARRFGDYLATMCGLIRRYGSSEPTLSVALFRLLGNCAAVLPDEPARWAALGRTGGARSWTTPKGRLPNPSTFSPSGRRPRSTGHHHRATISRWEMSSTAAQL